MNFLLKQTGMNLERSRTASYWHCYWSVATSANSVPVQKADTLNKTC